MENKHDNTEDTDLSDQIVDKLIPKDRAGKLFMEEKELEALNEKKRLDQMDRRFSSVRQQFASAQYPLRRAIKNNDKESYDRILAYIKGDIIDLCIMGLCWFGDVRLYDNFIKSWGDDIDQSDSALLRSLRADAPQKRFKSVQGIIVLEEKDSEKKLEIMEQMMDVRDSVTELLMSRADRSKTQNII